MSQLEGFEELGKKFKLLGSLEKGKVIRAGGNTGATAVLKAARGAVPQGSRPHKTYKGRWVAPGFAKRSLAKKVSLSRDKSRMVARIGVKPEAFYAVQFFELGTKHIPKQPWLTRAHEQSRPEVINGFRRGARRAMEKIAKR